MTPEAQFSRHDSVAADITAVITDGISTRTAQQSTVKCATNQRRTELAAVVMTVTIVTMVVMTLFINSRRRRLNKASPSINNRRSSTHSRHHRPTVYAGFMSSPMSPHRLSLATFQQHLAARGSVVRSRQYFSHRTPQFSTLPALTSPSRVAASAIHARSSIPIFNSSIPVRRAWPCTATSGHPSDPSCTCPSCSGHRLLICYSVINRPSPACYEPITTSSQYSRLEGLYYSYINR